MGYRRYRARGEAPNEVFIVTDGTGHRLYSTLGAARGVRTREVNYDKRYRTKADQNRWKIYRLVVDDNLEEVDPIV